MTREEAITMLKKLRTFHNGTYAKAVDLAIEALSEPQKIFCSSDAEWIPVDEMLPDVYEEVLIQYSGGHFQIVDIAVYDGEDRWSREDWDLICLSDKDKSECYKIVSTKGMKIVAWQPLPKPYKAERREYEEMDQNYSCSTRNER